MLTGEGLQELQCKNKRRLGGCKEYMKGEKKGRSREKRREGGKIIGIYDASCRGILPISNLFAALQSLSVREMALYICC